MRVLAARKAYWVKSISAVLVLAVVGAGAAIWRGSQRWAAATADYIRTLSLAAGSTGVAGPVNFDELHELPAPVGRYFRYALRSGQSLIRAVRISQAGELRAIGGAEDDWNDFVANQFIVSPSRGLVWDASIRLAPMLWVRVRDAYVAGQASGEVSLLSVVTLDEARGRPELNAGSLHRYLAESVWIPTALLPRAGVRWSPIDEHKALATITDSQTTVSLEFRFNDAGEVIGIYTPGRFAYLDGEFQLLPWEGHFRNYQERDGMRIPMEAEVQWHLPGGKFPVWRGRLVDVEYEFHRASE